MLKSICNSKDYKANKIIDKEVYNHIILQYLLK